MSDTSKTSTSKTSAAKTKSAVNWPVIIAAVLCVTFVLGVWLNNYRVSHAAAAAAAIAAHK
jgi:sensor domain CHASE-containing protein